MATSSAFCCAVVSPGLDGQQELPTVATHSARNYRAGGGGKILTGAGAFVPAANNKVSERHKTTAMIDCFQCIILSHIRRRRKGFGKDILRFLRFICGMK
jgi:hypothetical protein